jgi:hypothetical protein
MTCVGSDVTIAIVTRDRPDLTALAVESVRGSAPGVDIVVLDSGSAPEAIARLDEDLGDIALHRGSYRNAAAARNAALRLVRSEFVGFLDSDDLMRAEKIECLEPLLRGDAGAVMAVGRTDVIDANGIPRADLTEQINRLYDESDSFGSSYPGQCLRFTAYTSATLMRRSAVEIVGGYDETLPSMEDVDLYLRLSLIGKIKTARCVAASYRVWDQNVDPAASARGVLAVVSKHLGHPPDLPRTELRTSTFGLSLRAATSHQTLLQSREARSMLVKAAANRPMMAVASRHFWRILAASMVPTRIIQTRRRGRGGLPSASQQRGGRRRLRER